MKKWACVVKSISGYVVRFGHGQASEVRHFKDRQDAEHYAREFLLWG